MTRATSMRIALSPVTIVPRTYADLRRGVEAVLIAGRRSIEEAWVHTYHETGRLIHEHLLGRENRAGYGAKLYERLAADAGVSVRTLHECVQFHRLFPILRPVAELGWNQCRLLCQVGDEARRTALIKELKRGTLATVGLVARVRALNAEADAERAEAGQPGGKPSRLVRLLKPRRGTPGLYRLIARDDGLGVDAGFKLYLPLDAAAARGRSAGGIVRWEDERFVTAAGAGAADLFTYRAVVRRVVDGDTLRVSIALPHYQMDERLRLRGLDCPELDTPEGKAAKRFTEAVLAGATEVVITTAKVDKYDRYLADVHARREDGSEIHLNNALLREGHAVPMGAEEMTDWTP